MANIMYTHDGDLSAYDFDDEFSDGVYSGDDAIGYLKDNPDACKYAIINVPIIPVINRYCPKESSHTISRIYFDHGMHVDASEVYYDILNSGGRPGNAIYEYMRDLFKHSLGHLSVSSGYRPSHYTIGRYYKSYPSMTIVSKFDHNKLDEILADHVIAEVFDTNGEREGIQVNATYGPTRCPTIHFNNEIPEFHNRLKGTPESVFRAAFWKIAIKMRIQ